MSCSFWKIVRLASVASALKCSLNQSQCFSKGGKYSFIQIFSAFKCWPIWAMSLVKSDMCLSLPYNVLKVVFLVFSYFQSVIFSHCINFFSIRNTALNGQIPDQKYHLHYQLPKKIKFSKQWRQMPFVFGRQNRCGVQTQNKTFLRESHRISVWINKFSWRHPIS